MPDDLKPVIASDLTEFSVPEGTGDYGIDCENGRKCADSVVLAMREKTSPGLLWWTVRKLTERESGRGVAVGFHHRIAELLMVQN